MNIEEGSIGKTKSKKVVFFLFGVGIFTVVTILLLVAFNVWAVYNIHSKSHEEDNESPHEYKYTQYNSDKSEISEGLLSMFQELEAEESVSYKYEDGSKILISNFETEEYKCTGQCFCENDSDEYQKRSAATITRSSVTFLVAAFSTGFALSKANELFREECNEMSELSCSGSAVQSVVDDCVDFKTENIGIDNEDLRDMSSKYYVCKGSCLDSKNLKAEYVPSIGEKMRCGELIQSGTIEVPVPASEVRADSKKNVAEDNLRDLSFAKQTFQRKYLNPFCQSQSMKDDVKKVKIQVCVGEDDDYVNPTVSCRRTHGYGWV